MKYSKIRYLQDYYEKKLKTYRKGPKAVNWRNKKTQFLRFKKICEVGPLNKKTILDVGCGLGHLNKYLEMNKFKTEYKGMDISKQMIESAKEDFKKKNVKFYCKDLLKIKKSDIPTLKSDYVVNSGLFTVKNNISSKEWWGYIKKMIVTMYKLSRIGISFNLMKHNVDYKDRHLHYQSIDQLVSFLEKNVSKKIIIKNDYKLWEYTCYIYK